MRLIHIAAVAAVTATAATSAVAFSHAVAPASTARQGHAAPRRLVIGTDFPLQGSSADASADINRMIQLYLDQRNHRVGKYEVQIRVYDDSSANAGQWTDQQCAANARRHVRNTPEVAVLGTYNSGCAEIELPTLNHDPDGPMLMVSPSNTYPGLTKHWDTHEPAKFYPTGKRNYARIEATDDFEGVAGADFARHELHAKKILVLNDGQLYGTKLARKFIRRAKQLGMTILADKRWRPRANSYKNLFRSVRSSHPDAVYLSGLYENNGSRLIRDKIAVLGGNKKVPLLAPDGFTGYPDLDQSTFGRHLYLTYSGEPLQPRLAHNPVARTLVNAFERKYGRKPSTGYALDAVAALQVIDAAIRKSDGTRASVTKAVFSGHGITIPGDKSVLGRRLRIDPHTGDTNVRRITVEQLRHRHERFVKVISP